MHTVPTLKVTNKNITSSFFESRIILKYLDNNTNLEIDKWLFWDLGFLNPNVGKIIYPKLFRNEEPNLKDLPNLVEKFDYLNNSLSDREFLVDNKLSIADLSSCMLIENSQFRKDLINVANYPNIIKWITNIKNKIGNEKWQKVMNDFYKYRDSK